MLLKTAKIFASILLLAIGVVGIFVPILPGLALIFAGLVLINPTYKTRFVAWLAKFKKSRA